MGEPYVADKPDTKQGLKNRELRWVTVNTYLTEHLAGKNYRESKSSEEYQHPVSLTAPVIYFPRYSIIFLSCLCAFPFTLEGKISFT